MRKWIWAALLVLPACAGGPQEHAERSGEHDGAAHEREEHEERDRGEHRKSGNDREIEIVRGRIEVMRKAMHALMETGHPDWAERIEHAIHARELAIEGRRDEEAAHIRETAPDREQLIELLLAATRAWEELGNRHKAEQTEELANVYREQVAARAERRRGSEREQHLAQALERFMVRVEELEVHVERLTQRLEQLEAR